MTLCLVRGHARWHARRAHRVQGYLTDKKTQPLGPYRRPMRRVPCRSYGGGRFLMGEVPLYTSVPERSTTHAAFQNAALLVSFPTTWQQHSNLLVLFAQSKPPFTTGAPRA